MLENDAVKATFDSHGFLTKIHLKEEGLDVDVRIEFVFYGTSMTSDRNSGAYLFLPQGPAKPVVIEEGTPVTVVRGPHMSSVTVTAQDFQHTVTLKTSPGKLNCPLMIFWSKLPSRNSAPFVIHGVNRFSADCLI